MDKNHGQTLEFVRDVMGLSEVVRNMYERIRLTRNVFRETMKGIEDFEQSKFRL